MRYNLIRTTSIQASPPSPREDPAISVSLVSLTIFQHHHDHKRTLRTSGPRRLPSEGLRRDVSLASTVRQIRHRLTSLRRLSTYTLAVIIGLIGTIARVTTASMATFSGSRLVARQTSSRSAHSTLDSMASSETPSTLCYPRPLDLVLK